MGNTHKDLDTTERNCHQWRAFIRLEDSGDIKGNMLSRLATHCTFFLDKSFKQPVRKSDVKVGANDVGLQMKGWGYFDIKLRLHFRENTGLKPHDFCFELSFDGSGRWKNYVLSMQRKHYDAIMST